MLDLQEQILDELPFPVQPGEAARFWLPNYAARHGSVYDAKENADRERPAV